MATKPLFSLCLIGLNARYAEFWKEAAKYPETLEICTGLAQWSAAKKANGIYLAFPGNVTAWTDWDRNILDVLASLNQPMMVDENSRPLFKLRIHGVKVRSKAQPVSFLVRWYRKVFPRRLVTIDA